MSLTPTQVPQRATLIESKLSLKQASLYDVKMPPFIDHVFKLRIPMDTTEIEIGTLVSFDGLSLRRFELDTGVRSNVTLKGVGKVSLQGLAGTGDLVAEVADVGGKVFLGGSLLQARKIFEMFRKKVGFVSHNGKLKFRARLKVGETDIGKAEVSATKVNAFKLGHGKYLPGAIRTAALADTNLLKRPALFVSSVLSLDLGQLRANCGDIVQFTIRTNYEINNLRADHQRDVVISALSNVRTSVNSSVTLQQDGKKALNLGRYAFSTLKSGLDV